MLEWRSLLSARRIPHTGEPIGERSDPSRTAYQRDADRIVFSSAFRRLSDKTQVFPLPENDQIHTRLTHSLEVSSIGRSLGAGVGSEIIARHGLAEFTPRDIGDVVGAACLAHDIGNPPFGHSGEDAIGEYFRSRPRPAALSEREWVDFIQFEGNAQGFRILTRLQMEADGGMRLTAATLGTFAKYPRESGADLRDPRDGATKKHGFFQAERTVFETVARELGLARRDHAPGGLAYGRHPLAFLVEAADDISYLILDLEDALRLKFVPRDESEALLTAIAARGKRFARPGADARDHDRVGYLRAKSITQLVGEVCEVFLAREEAMLRGEYLGSLTDEIPSAGELRDIRALSRREYYNHPSVREVALAGYEVLGGLLDIFVPAALAESDGRSTRHTTLVGLLGVGLANSIDPYQRLLRVTDYVSGMTDRFAVSLYRRLKGIAVPGLG